MGIIDGCEVADFSGERGFVGAFIVGVGEGTGLFGYGIEFNDADEIG